MAGSYSVVFCLGVFCCLAAQAAGGLGAEEPPPRSLRAGPPPPTPLEQFRGDTSRGLLAVYDMAHWWLDQVVQPRTLNYLPENGLALEGLTDPQTLRDNWQTLARYAVGFFIVAIIGVLMIVGMLVGGLTTPCCRCCKQCKGGRRKARELERDLARQSYRVGCGVSLVVLLCACLLGCVAMFALNQELRRELTGDDSVFDRLDRQVSGVPSFLDSSVTEINQTIYTGAVDTKDRVFSALYDLPNSAFGVVEDETNFTYVFNVLKTFSENIEDLNATLSLASQQALSLSADVNTTLPKLETIKTNILDALQPCISDICNGTKADVSAMSVSINMVPVLVNISVLDEVVDYVLASQFIKYVRDINDTVTNITKDVSRDLTGEVRRGEDEVDQALQEQLLDRITDIRDTVNDIDLSVVTDGIREAKSRVQDKIADYIYGGFLGIAAIPCIIILLFVIGVLHGSCRPRMPGGTGCCPADRAAGADWLFAGIGLTLAFYWLLAAVTLALFLGGGLAHTEACRYLVHYDEPNHQAALRVAEQLVPDDFLLYNFSLLSAYNSCRYDNTLYTAFNLAENGLNLAELLDMVEFQNIINDIKDTPVDIPNNIVLLSPELNSSLTILDTALSTVNIAAILAELSNNITEPADLNSIADKLGAVISQPGIDNSTLMIAIDNLRTLNDIDIKSAEAKKWELYGRMQAVQATLGGVEFATIARSLGYTQEVFNSRGKELFSGLLNSTADDAFGALSLFREQTIEAAESSLARCYPAYNLTASAVNSVCVSSLYLLNGLAFSLGWVLFFLFLGLILAFKVADHYRRAVGEESADGTDGYSAEFHPIPHGGATAGHLHMPAAINPAYQPDEATPFNLLYRPIAGQQAGGAYDKRTPPPDYSATERKERGGEPYQVHTVAVEPYEYKTQEVYYPRQAKNRVSPVDLMRPYPSEYGKKWLDGHFTAMENPY